MTKKTQKPEPNNEITESRTRSLAAFFGGPKNQSLSFVLARQYMYCTRNVDHENSCVGSQCPYHDQRKNSQITCHGSSAICDAAQHGIIKSAIRLLAVIPRPQLTHVAAVYLNIKRQHGGKTAVKFDLPRTELANQ